jgi:hypothetical protein
MRSDLFTHGGADAQEQSTPRHATKPLSPSQRETSLVLTKSRTRLDVRLTSAERFWHEITGEALCWRVPPLRRQGLARLAVFLVGVAAIMAQPLFLALAVIWSF